MADQLDHSGERDGESRLEMALWSTAQVEKWLRELKFTEEIIGAFLGQTINCQYVVFNIILLYRSGYGW